MYIVPRLEIVFCYFKNGGGGKNEGIQVDEKMKVHVN